MPNRPIPLAALARLGALAGLAGGAAEIVWVSLYAALSGGDAVRVARGVGMTVNLTPPTTAAAVAAGIGIHLLLGLALGVGLAVVLRGPLSREGRAGQLLALLVAALVLVWAANFLVLLPIVSPAFVHLLPYPVSLFSKLLFGSAAAGVMLCRPARQIASR